MPIARALEDVREGEGEVHHRRLHTAILPLTAEDAEDTEEGKRVESRLTAF